MPHLSLLYGALDDNTKKNIINSLDLKLPMEVLFDRSTLWRTSADIPVNEWKKLVDLELH